MVMAQSVSFILEGGHPARLPSKGRSKQVTPIRDARYAPDRPAAARRRLCLLAASARPDGVLGCPRPVATIDARGQGSHLLMPTISDAAAERHQAAAAGFPCFFRTRSSITANMKM